MNEVGSKNYKPCQRLTDYICVVGPESDTSLSSERGEFGNNGVRVEPSFLMRRFPEEDHSDFPLPLNIVNFCQPEGCLIIGPKKTAVRETKSFVFTLTDKDSGLTRYGICLNFYRPILKNHRSHRRRRQGSKNAPCPHAENRVGGSGEEKSSDSAFSSDYRSSCHIAQSDSDHGVSHKSTKSQPRGSVSSSRRHHSHRRHRKKRKGAEEDEIAFLPLGPSGSVASSSEHYHHHHVSKRRREKAGKFYVLTSLCLVSHYPFFTNFRECLQCLKHLIDATGNSLLSLSPRRRERGSTSSLASKRRVKSERLVSIWYYLRGNEANAHRSLGEEADIPEKDDDRLAPYPADHFVRRELHALDSWIRKLLSAPVPSKSSFVSMEILPSKVPLPLPINTSLMFAIPDHTRFPLCDFPIHLPIELLGVSTCIQVLMLIMLEKKVVFQSMEYSVLTISILAFTKLLYPLEYMFPVIPLLPPSMTGSEQLLLAPTPFIIGIPTNFFAYKRNLDNYNYSFLDDVWLVDLDINQITPPIDTPLSDIPALPEPEGRILKTDLKQALASLSFQPIKNFDDLPPECIQKLTERQLTPDCFTPVSGHNPFIFGNDSDSVDIATRIAMVNFFNSKNVLAYFGDHTRTLRLYPRPIVSFQIQSFLRSRDKNSSFINQFSSTQAVEFFGEWNLRPTNVAYLRIHSGVYDPTLIGDKSKWFAQHLEPVFYSAIDDSSSLSCILREAVNSKPEEECATDESGSDSEDSGGTSSSSNSSSSLSDFMSSDMTTTAVSHQESHTKNKSDSGDTYTLSPEAQERSMGEFALSSSSEKCSSYQNTLEIPQCKNTNIHIEEEAGFTSEESEENSTSIATTKTMRCLKQPQTVNKSSSPSFGSDISIAGSLCSENGKQDNVSGILPPSTPCRKVSGTSSGNSSNHISRQSSSGCLNSLGSPLHADKKRSSLSSSSLSHPTKNEPSGSSILNEIGKLKLNRSRRNSKSSVGNGSPSGSQDSSTPTQNTSEDMAQELFYNIEQLTLQAKRAAESFDFARKNTFKASSTSKTGGFGSGVNKDTFTDFQSASKNVVDDLSKKASNKKQEILRALGDSESYEAPEGADPSSKTSSRRSSKDLLRSLSRDLISSYTRSNSNSSSASPGSGSLKSPAWKFPSASSPFKGSSKTGQQHTSSTEESPAKAAMTTTSPKVPPREKPPQKSYQESFVRPETEKRRSMNHTKKKDLPPPNYPPPPLPTRIVTPEQQPYSSSGGLRSRRRSKSPLFLKTGDSPSSEGKNEEPQAAEKEEGHVHTDTPIPSNVMEKSPLLKKPSSPNHHHVQKASTPPPPSVSLPTGPPQLTRSSSNLSNVSQSTQDMLFSIGSDFSGFASQTSSLLGEFFTSEDEIDYLAPPDLLNCHDSFTLSRSNSDLGHPVRSRSSTPTLSARSTSPAPRSNSGIGFYRNRVSIIRYPRSGDESVRNECDSGGSNRSSLMNVTVKAENDIFIKDIIDKILQGEGISWLKLSRFKKLMEAEVNRNFALSSLNKSFNKRAIGSDEHVGDVLMKENVWNGILKLSLAIIHGLEVTINNCGIGGMASAYHILEIAHTHFWRKELEANPSSGSRSISKYLSSTPSSPFGSRDNLALRSVSPRPSISLSLGGASKTAPPPPPPEGGVAPNSHSLELKRQNPPYESLVSPGSGGTSADSENEITKALLNQKKTLLMNRMASIESNFSTTEENMESDSTSLACSETGSFITNPTFSLQRSMNNRFGIHSSMRSVLSDSELEHSNFSCEKKVPNSSVIWPNKTPICGGFRFHGGTLQPSCPANNPPGVERRYIFQKLVENFSSRKDGGLGIWENMQLWENIFMDIVVQERGLIGMDSEAGAMLERYKNLSSIERKRLEHEEDRLLSTLLYNIVAFMIMMRVDKAQIRKKVRRLLGKSHIGLSYSQEINQLLDDLTNLTGNDIDLKPLPSRQLNRQCFTVHTGTDAESDLLFMEVRHDGLVLRTINGSVLERWFFEKLVNMTFSPKTRVICLWRRSGGHTQLHKYYTKKCKDLYYCIKEAMENAASRGSNLSGPGHELGGEFPVEDLNTGEGGLLQVCMEGVGLLFANSKFFIRMDHIRKCFTQKGGIFILEEFNPKTRQIIQRRYSSAMAHDICYSVLCVFSYVAAGQKQKNISKNRQNSVKS